jgi:hypothetical protein
VELSLPAFIRIRVVLIADPDSDPGFAITIEVEFLYFFFSPFQSSIFSVLKKEVNHFKRGNFFKKQSISGMYKIISEKSR